MTTPLAAVPANQLRTENDSVIEFARAQSDVEIEKIDDPNGETANGLFAIVPKGKELESVKKFLDEYRTEPERRIGTAVLTTEDSFIRHVDRYASADTILFARRDGSPAVTAVYNYHPTDAGQRKAGFGDFRAVYTFPLSEEWKKWREKNDTPMSALDFAQFLEDRLVDIYAVGAAESDAKLMDFAASFGGMFASPTRLLELSRSLEINAAVMVRQATRLDSGEINIAFVENHLDGDGRPIRVPNMFVIGIPIFVDGIGYHIVCRLRYRVASGGGITWWYSMVKPQQYLDDAVKESIDTIDEAVEPQILYGAPEAK